jgi:hypothetical protein
MERRVIRLTVLFAVYASLCSPAYAYLDPVTGSIAVQVVIGAVATWLMYSKMFLAKAKNFVTSLFTRRSNPE